MEQMFFVYMTKVTDMDPTEEDIFYSTSVQRRLTPFKRICGGTVYNVQSQDQF